METFSGSTQPQRGRASGQPREIESVCQAVEGVFARARRGELSLDADALNALHRSLEDIRNLLTPHAVSGRRKDLAEKSDPISMAHAVAHGSSRVAREKEAEPGASLAKSAGDVTEESVRVSAGQLDRILLEVEELVPPSMATAHGPLSCGIFLSRLRSGKANGRK